MRWLFGYTQQLTHNLPTIALKGSAPANAQFRQRAEAAFGKAGELAKALGFAIAERQMDS